MFKKIFPEYVEKYNEQKQLEQSGSSPENQPSKEEPGVLHQRVGVGSSNDDVIEQGENNGEVLNDVNKNRKQSKNFPLWLLLLLGSVFGLVMALPLIQL
ncbi:E2 ubiquitin-conjugating enzyme [Ranunculus cassubicifolius]